jgi:quinol monooxygenase YgiN
MDQGLKLPREERFRMPKNGQPFTVGEWLVKSGKESEFIDAWNAFAKWTVESQKGAGTGHLLQDSDYSRRFLSYGPWENGEAIDEWRQQTNFQEFLERARELCDDIKPRTLNVVSLVRSQN